MNIFISYAREDVKEANKLYQQLSAIPEVVPWLDSKNLLPGVKWKTEIMEALRTSDFFIVLLSENSVSKSGFVQHEIREALEKLKELPPDRIFIIPARLDNCHPSHPELNEIQWVDLFPNWEEGYKLIEKSIHIYAKKPAKPSITTSTGKFIIETITSPEEFEQRLKVRGEMRGCDAMELEFNHQTVQGIDLTGSNFVRCKFFDCNFQNANLKGVNFEGAVFNNCKFSGANLWGVNFWGANIMGIHDLNKAKFMHTNFFMVKLLNEQQDFVYSDSNIVDLSDYNSFLHYFISKVGMSESQISETFVWFNHRYFRLMYRKYDNGLLLF